MSNRKIILDSPDQVAKQFAVDFAASIHASGDFHVALSGGSTPKLLFELWASNDCPKTDWSKVHFYWGDERCVAPTDPDSNFGVTNELFFEPVGIAKENIHRVLGENDPEQEAARYSQCLSTHLTSSKGKPIFDLVILGMGGDGHTASIFPNQMNLMDDDRICAVATHPDSGQKRVTLTGPVISNAKQIAFLVTGNSKTEKFRSIVDNDSDADLWPATRFFRGENTTIYLDKAAAGQ